MTEYYVSAAGSDSNDGSFANPWKTVSKANSAMASMGLNDRVRFNRGDTFYGAIRPPITLNPTYPGWLKIGSYGTGALPVITGYKLLNIASGWVQHDANTWKIDISAGQSGITYTGYDSVQGYGNVGILRVDGAVKSVNKKLLADLANQWDYWTDGYHQTGTTLYVRSTAKPTTLAADIRCTVDVDGIRTKYATDVSGLDFCGWGGCAYTSYAGAQRNRLIGCTLRDIGGSYLTSTVRYGNGVNLWGGTTEGLSDFYAEHNTVHDVYDTAWSPQGGQAGSSAAFTNVTWRRNLTYRCSQAEEYWYLGTVGFVNVLSEYNTNLFIGYGWGADVRDDPDVRAALLTSNWGTAGDVTLRRNIYLGVRGCFSYHQNPPVGLVSNRNVILLEPGTKMQFQTSQTVEQFAAWSAGSGREQNSAVQILPAGGGLPVSDADVTSAIGSLDVLAKTGQPLGDFLAPIHFPWRAS